jgi:putative SOS response-associated peptidase YedK
MARQARRPIKEIAATVVLTEIGEIVTWLLTSWDEAKALQRPLPADRLVVLS